MERNPLLNDSVPGLAGKLAQQKGAVAATLAAVLLAFGLSLYALYLDNYFLFSVAQPVLFLVAGAVHVRQIRKAFHSFDATETWTYTSILAAFIFVLFCVAAFLAFSLPILMLIAGAGAFVLPLLCAEMFRIHLQLSFSNAIPWQLTNELSVKYPDVYLTGIPVRFKVIPDESGKVALSTDFKALGRMTLGEVFCDLVLKERKKGTATIELKAPDQAPYHWVFFTRTILGWETALDPTVPLHKNNIKENTTIYVQRLSEASSLVTKGKKKVNFVV